MHDLAVGQGWVSAPEFWRMTPWQFWWMYRAKMPALAQSRPRDMAEVARMVKAAKAKEKQ
jgi:hypothetical protein